VARARKKARQPGPVARWKKRRGPWAGTSPFLLEQILLLVESEGIDGLAPVALNQHPFAVVVLPVMGNPDRMGMGGTIPAAGSPDIVVAIPAVVAGGPDHSVLRGRAAAFNDRGRRPFVRTALRKRRRGHQTERKQQRQCNLLDHGEAPFRFDCRWVDSRIQLRCDLQRRTVRKVVVEEKWELRRKSRAQTHTRIALAGMRAWRVMLGETKTNYRPKWAAFFSVKLAHFSGRSSAAKIAETGHAGTQAPQSMHSTGSMNS